MLACANKLKFNLRPVVFSELYAVFVMLHACLVRQWIAKGQNRYEWIDASGQVTVAWLLTKTLLVIYISVIPGTSGTQALMLASLSTYHPSDSSALLFSIFIARNELYE